MKELKGEGCSKQQPTYLLFSLLDPASESFENELQRFSVSLNRRLWKGFRKTLTGEVKDVVDQRFRDAGFEEPTKTLASFPPEVLPNLVRFLATKPQI